MLSESSRKIRLKNEFKVMCALPFNNLVSWKIPPGQKPPYVRSYLVTFRNQTMVKNAKGAIVPAMETTVQIDLPDGFPAVCPTVRVAPGSLPPFHPNWWKDGTMCPGSIWTQGMWLWDFVLKVGHVLAFDPAITNIHSPACFEAIAYWQSNIRSFPCGTLSFSHPKGF